MTNRRVPNLVVLPLCLLPCLANGEDSRQPLIGKRVRLSWSVPDKTSKSAVGTLVAETESALFLETGKRGRVEVPRHSLVGLEISRRKSHKKLGPGIGFLAGSVLGAIGGYSAEKTIEEGLPCIGCQSSKTTAMLVDALVVGVLAAGVGAVVSPGERWEPVPREGIHVGAAAGPGGGVAVRVALSF